MITESKQLLLLAIIRHMHIFWQAHADCHGLAWVCVNSHEKAA